MSDLFELLAQVEPERGPWILVTMVAAEGSTYRTPGAHLLLNAEGYSGMLSGGCLEAEVMARCQPLLQGKVPFLAMEIDTRRLLGCHGQIGLVAETLPPDLVNVVTEAREQRQKRTLYTSMPGPGWLPTSITPRDNAFEHDLEPSLRLLVFGSGPGVPPLLRMAEVLGWESKQLVLAGDPAVPLRPQADWTALPSAVSVARQVDERTVCIVMNHHVGRDTETLLALWNTSTPFLGMLGSRRRRDEILERIAWSVDLDSRVLHAPVGIELGAEGAAAIALEICAQIQREVAGAGSARQDLRSSLAV